MVDRSVLREIGRRFVGRQRSGIGFEQCLETAAGPGVLAGATNDGENAVT